MRRYTLASVFALLFLVSALHAAPVELVEGSLKLTLYPETGTFSLSQLSEIGKNRFEPLFEDRNCSSTTWFSVLSNGRIFKLGSKVGKPIGFEQTGTGATFVFTLVDDFQAVQSFSFINDPVSGFPYALRIETTIENTSGKELPLAIKALIDTNLGESEGIHFFTDLRNRISSESRFDALTDLDSVIVSKNSNSSLMFYLYGNGTTRPEYVYASNWNRLNTLTWQPEYVEGRSFNTLYAINDSALLFVWPEQMVAPNKTCSSVLVLGPYDSSRIHQGASVSGSAKFDDSKNSALVRQILARIHEIESNPDSASDAELQKLNDMIDTLLSQKKE